MIILPAIDIRNGKCVRLVQGDYGRETVYSDTPGKEAARWAESGARILHLVDLDAARAGFPVNLETVKEISSTVDIPCELGGGIRTVADAEKAFEAGVSRVILGTAACEKPETVKQFVEIFGAEKIVAGIDAKNGKAAIRGWLESSGREALELASEFVSYGIRRIIYTDISTDGMLSGPNLNAVANLCDAVPECSVIASGGVSSASDISNLKNLGRKNLEGAIVGKALYDGRTTLAELLTAAGA